MLKRQKVQRSKRSNKEIVPKALFVLVVEGLLALEWAGPGRDFLARPGKPGSVRSGPGRMVVITWESEEGFTFFL